jgi:PiT family inorganic phosphate transporter
MFGFSVTIILMYFIRVMTRKTAAEEMLFKEPKKNTPPPPIVRGILFLTCTMVSFFHGSNDGQKGVGLVMLVLIGIVPAYFALDSSFDPSQLSDPLKKIELVLSRVDSTVLSASDKKKLSGSLRMNSEMQAAFGNISTVEGLPKQKKFELRRDVMLMDRYVGSLLKLDEIRLSHVEQDNLKKELKKVRKITDYSPRWVIVMISLSLGLGTMIGWKRIVKTIGEKIGKEHLTYAQGASAEMVASITIGLSSNFGWPVSTTHVLSSGIAGGMVASKGVKNLQPDTVRNILIAWFLTLPVVMLMGGSLFLLFRSIF